MYLGFGILMRNFEKQNGKRSEKYYGRRKKKDIIICRYLCLELHKRHIQSRIGHSVTIERTKIIYSEHIALDTILEHGSKHCNTKCTCDISGERQYG
jgi:hypothetical protein